MTDKQYNIQAAFKTLQQYNLSAGVETFLKSLQREFKRSKDLSDKQMKSLFDIRDHVQAEANNQVIQKWI